MRITSKAAIGAALCCSMSSAIAHHASAPHFDANQPIQIEGIVTRFEFVNPHAYLYLDVTDAEGNVATWNCEMSAASPLARQGWTKDLFPPGSSIRIDGTAARRDPHGCAFQAGTLEDGTQISRSGEIVIGNLVSNADARRDASGSAVSESESIAGTWITAPRQRSAAGSARTGGGPPGMERFANLLTAAGRAAAENYDERYDDPALSCSPSSILRVWGEPNGISKITQSASSITIQHEFMDTERTIDLTTRQHPEGFQRSLSGHSVGWFEGDTLVIETVGFAAGVLLPHPGIMHTEDMKIVERLSLSEDGNQLTREYEVTDPAYLSSTYSGSNRWNRTDLTLNPYNCTELSGINNVRPGSQ